MVQGFTLAEALNTLENGDWHSIAYVSADRNKQEGGRIIRIPECRIVRAENRHVADKPQRPIAPAAKAQNHSLNATRNVRLRNGLVRKFNIYLLFSLDNLPVL